MNYTRLFLVAALLAMAAVGCSRQPEGPLAGKVFKELQFTGLRSDLFERAIWEAMSDAGASFADTGIGVTGSVQWVHNGTFVDYQGTSPWFQMIISTDSDRVILVACIGSDFGYPETYPYVLARESAPAIVNAIRDYL